MLEILGIILLVILFIIISGILITALIGFVHSLVVIGFVETYANSKVGRTK